MSSLIIKAERRNLIIHELDDKAQSVLGEMWKEVCERGKSLSFKIVSGSMLPMIGVSDVVKVSRVEPSRIRIGDIAPGRSGHRRDRR